MDLKELARAIASIKRTLDELESGIKRNVLKGLEVDRILFYEMPDARPEDVDTMRREVLRALGSEEDSDIGEAVRRSFESRSRRVVSGGSRRKVALVTNFRRRSDVEGNDVLPDLPAADVEVETFDASEYPLSAVQGVAEYGPDAVVIAALEPGEDYSVRVERLEVEGREETLKSNEDIGSVLLGVNDSVSLLRAIRALSDVKENYLIECTTPARDELDQPEADERCIAMMKEALEGLLRALRY